jgi:hypothetical protein
MSAERTIRMSDRDYQMWQEVLADYLRLVGNDEDRAERISFARKWLKREGQS